LLPADNRCIYWELERPPIKEPPADKERETEGTTCENIWPQQLLDRFSQLPKSEKEKIRRAIVNRYESVVEVNDVITSLLASNTAVYLLGSNEQSKSILFYLLKYMTKDSVALANSITVINDTLNHIRRYPSTADDSGTDSRTLKYFLQRVINSLSSSIEVSATQATHLLNPK
jgi:hypothetical protein